MSPTTPASLAGKPQGCADEAPDLAAIDRAIDHKPAPPGGVARDKSVRTETAQMVMVELMRRLSTVNGMDMRFVAADAVKTADALIAALEAKRHG
jgi:hypothetical protein